MDTVAAHILLHYWVYATLIAGLLLLIVLRPFFDRKPDNHLKINISGTNITLPKLTSPIVRKDALKVPSIPSLLRFSLLGFLTIFLAHSIAAVVGLEVDESLRGSDLAAVQVAALSVLFPLVILILGKEKASENAIFPDHEILIRYSWAYPAAMVLPILSTYFLFGHLIRTHALANSVLTLASLSILLFVTYRLLELTFSPTKKIRAENELLRVKISQYAGGITADRVGMAMTHAKGQQSEFKIKADVLNWIERQSISGSYTLAVSSHKTGKITAIDFAVLRKIRIAIESYEDREMARSNQISDASDSEDIPRSLYSIRLISYVGKYLSADSADSLFVLTLPDSLRGSNTEENLKQRGISAFTIDGSQLSDESSIIFDGISESIFNIGKIAIETKSLHKLNITIERYQSLYAALCTILPDIAREVGNDNSYNLSVNPFFHSGPLEQIVSDLSELLQILLASGSLSDKFVSTFLYIPYYLGSAAVSRHDAPALSQFLALNCTQFWMLREQKKEAYIDTTFQWTESLIKYSINPALKKSSDDRFWTQTTKLTLWRVQHFGKLFIDSGNIDSFARACKLCSALGESLTDQYQTYLDDLHLYGAMFANQRPLPAETIAQAKYVLQMQQESLLAWAWYILYLMDKAAPEDDPTLITLFQQCLDLLPKRFDETLRFQVEFEKHERFDHWDWVAWESHPKGQAFHPINEQYTDRIFALLFARSSVGRTPAAIDNQSDLRRQNVHKLDKSGGVIRALIQSISNRREHAFFTKSDQDAQTIEERLDAIVKLAVDAEYDQIASQQLSTNKIEEAKFNFRDAFYESALIRQFISVDVLPVFENAADFLGINQLIERDVFVERAGAIHSELGRHFGHDAGRFEDLYIFESLINQTKNKAARNNIESAVALLRNIGCPLSDIYIITNGYPKLLRNSGKIKHRKSDDQFSCYSIADGDIPIINVTGPEKQKDRIVVLHSKALKIENLVETEDQLKLVNETPFRFDLLDPANDSQLNEKIINDNPPWLRGTTRDEKMKFAALRLWLRILEKIRVTIVDVEKIELVSEV